MADSSAASAHPTFVLAVVFRTTDEVSLAALLAQVRADAGLGILLLPLTTEALESAKTRLSDPSIRLAHEQVRDGMAFAPERLHLVPPQSLVRIRGGRLQVEPVVHQTTPSRSIEDSLLALAESYGDRIICMLLASAATEAFNGAVGLKEMGGLLMVESEADGGEPTRSEAALLADCLTPREALGKRINEYLAYRRDMQMPWLVGGEDLARIISIIARETGMDFGEYKKSTLQRRIQRRMGVRQLFDSKGYIDFLDRTPDEVITLYREMLIGVTRFFRDPEAFKVLAEAVIRPLLVKLGRQDPIRVWVAGCATGEEAYSIAITIREIMVSTGVKVPVKIFATDLDRQSVEFASHGHYPLAIANDVSPERLERFFTRRPDGFQVVKALREMVVFAQHNILRDPPFFRMDLVTCRNLLIYLQPALQRRLFNAFHFALNNAGYLMLGTSEALGEMAQFFTAVDGKWKVFQKKGERLPRMSDSLIPDFLSHRPRPPLQAAAETAAAPTDSLQDAIQQTLLREFIPAFLIADEHFDIHYTSGNVERFVTLPRGKPSFNLIKMTGRELAVALSTGIRRALREETEVVYDEIAVGDAGPNRRVRLMIRPFTQRADLRHLAVVIFEEPDAAIERQSGEQFDLKVQSDQRMKDLEVELEQTKESLQAAIEELETSNEELQATNEELLAANEELQSTNEELQSVNEELYTVNTEHQSKISELTELNNDILNLLSSTNIGTVFLDQQLCVRKFTQAVTKQINLIDKDIGRPLAHISTNIAYANLVADAQEVLQTLVPKQRKVCTHGGHWQQMRLLPYRTEDNVIKGVVITFIDISEIKVNDEMIRKLATAFENTASIMMITNASGDIDYVNQRFVETTGWSAEEVVGKNPRLLRDAGVSDSELDGLRAALISGHEWRGRFRNRRRNGESYEEEATIIALRDTQGDAAGHLKLATVVTVQHV
jgi:two-component system, chemotaxis family, CheB/CheR fusion protein